MTPAQLKARERHLQKNYRLSNEDYDALLASQGGGCAICGTDSCYTNPRSGKMVALSVDHNHDTGTVRGILCKDCNIGLANFKDNPDLLHRAVDYLAKESTHVKSRPER